MMQMSRRLLAVFLCLCLCASLFPAALAAETAEEAITTARQNAGDGWFKNSNGTWSYKINGEYAEGLLEIDGALYFFDYYSHEMLVDDGEYLGGSDGMVIAGSDGKLLKEGWGRVYSEGPVVGSGIFYMRNYHSIFGLQEIDGKLYFFHERYGYAIVSDTVEVDGVRYRANSDGVLTKLETGDGWHVVDGSTYYYQGGDPVTNEVLEIDGKLYYFDPDGIMAAGCRFSTFGPMTLSGGWYCAREDGSLLRSEWYVESGERYYYGDDGKMYIGLQRLDGGTYYFNENGSLFTNGYIALEGSTYHADADGILTELQEGWNELNGNTIYVSGGAPLCGEPYTIDGKLYAFDGSGNLVRSSVTSFFGDYYLTDADGIIQTSTWYDDEDSRRLYFGSEGPALRGLQTIDGKKYIFASEGLPEMLKDQTVTLNGKTYVLGSDGQVLDDGWVESPDGRRYLKNSAFLTGLQEIEGKRYLFGEDSYLLCSALSEWNGEYYLAGEDGVLAADVWYSDAEGSRFRFGPDGTALRGMQEIDGNRYVFATDGLPALLKDQDYTLDGKTYHLDENGVASLLPQAPAITEQPKNLSVKEGGTAAFSLKAEGDDLHYQWFVRTPEDAEWTPCGEDSAQLRIPASEETDGSAYRCQVSNTVGSLISDTVTLTVQYREPTTGWVTENGKRYYYDENGTMLTSQWLRLNGSSYYFGEDGALVTNSWLTDDGAECYVSSNGVKVLSNWVTSDGKRYYMDAKGRKVTGRQSINGQSFIFDENGVLLEARWVQTNGKWYYLNDNGNVLKSRWLQLDGKWYFLTADGARLESDWLKDGGKWYYFDADGVMAADQKLFIEGKNYFFDSKGVMQTGSWVQAGGNWYYLTGSGAVSTGWQKIGTVWYWFDGSGIMATGWHTIDGRLYCFQSSGAMMSSKWAQQDSSWYYLASSGAAAVGWQKIGGVWYWFDSSSAMATGLRNIDGAVYSFKVSGAMQSSQWVQDGSDWYYLGSSGAALTGWQKISGKWYWFESDGRMISDTSRDINGKTYFFNASGVCTNP